MSIGSGGITATGGTEYDATKAAFTFMGNSTQTTVANAAGKMLASSQNAWQTLMDNGVAKPGGGDFMITGEGIKNALMAFNQNQLQTSAAGQVAWMGSDVHANTAQGMFTVLTDAHTTGIS